MIDISLEELLKFIPQFIAPFAIGCSFLGAYMYASRLKRPHGTMYFLVAYVIGFIGQNIWELLPSSLSGWLWPLPVIVVIAVLGLLLGKFIRSKAGNWIMKKALRLHRLPSAGPWDGMADVVRGNYVAAYLSEAQCTVWGAVHSMESESDDPLIAVKNAEFEFAEGTSIDTITFTGYDKLNSLLFFRPSQCSMLKFVYKPGSALFTSAKKKLTEEQKDLIKSEIARYSGELEQLKKENHEIDSATTTLTKLQETAVENDIDDTDSNR